MSLTSVIRYVFALDNTATDGRGKTGLAFGDITAKQVIQGGTLTSLTTETITTLGTYQAPTSAAHIRIKELANTDPTKGVYEVHFHDTNMVNTGKRLWLFLSASGASFEPLEMDLIPYMDGAAQAATDLKDFADTGYDPATHKVQGVVLVDTVTAVTGLTASNLDATVSSRASQASVDTIDGIVDTIVERTNNLPDDPADQSLVIAATDAIIADIAALPTAVENADTLLDRDMSTGADSGSTTVRTVRQALRALRNKWGFPGGTYTVYKENDSTISWTGTPTTDASAEPLTGLDPAGP